MTAAMVSPKKAAPGEPRVIDQLKGEVLDGFRFLMPYYQYLDTLAGDMEPNR